MNPSGTQSGRPRGGALPPTWDGSAAELLTADEAAALLKVPASTIRHWVREGRMPCYRLGPRAMRFTRELLLEFVRETRI